MTEADNEEKYRKRGLGLSQTEGRSSSPRVRGVHPDVGHDARPNLAVLLAGDRTGTQIAQRGRGYGRERRCRWIAGRQQEIHTERQRKWEVAPKQRRPRRH